MKLLKDLLLTLLMISSLLWVIAQDSTTDIGKLIRLATYIASAIIWAHYSRPGKRLFQHWG